MNIFSINRWIVASTKTSTVDTIKEYESIEACFTSSYLI